MKISGFYDEVSSKLDTQIDLIKEFGESYLCPRGVDGKNISAYTVEEFDEKVKPRLVENGIMFSSIGSPIGKIKLRDEKAFEAQTKKLEELFKIAKSMDCKYIRVFSFHLPKCDNPNEFLGEVVAKLKVWAEMAEKEEIILIHENEKFIFGDTPKRFIALAKAVNSPSFKLCYDASNYVQCGVDCGEAYELTRPFTVYYHIKDCSKFKVETPLGLGVCNYDHIISCLKAQGYDGFLTLEPHTIKYVALRRLLTVVPIMPNYRKTFKEINKAKNKNFFKKVTAKDVFVWQYEALKEMLA